MTNAVRRCARILSALILASAGIMTTLFPSAVYAAATGVTVGSAVSGLYGTEIPITGISFTGTGVIPVTLRVSHGTLTINNTTGLTFTTPTSGESYLAFSGSIADVNSALQSLTYMRSGIGDDTLEIASLEDGEVLFGGHIYEFIDAGGIDWTGAEAAAASLTKYGKSGYLTTVTSEEENTYVAERLSSDGWMGASDAAFEGDWQWVTGPETGTSFWLGLDDGSPVSGRFNAWAGGEPNDSSGEDCGQFYVDNGTWNDLPCVGFTLDGYVVEYGDATPISIVTGSLSISVSGNTHEIETCQELVELDQYTTNYDSIVLMNDIDCQGIAVSPLYDDADFSGEFDGQGYSIYNLVIDDSEDSDVGLFSKTYDGAHIHDVTLASGSVTGSGDTGALIGELEEGTTIDSVISHLDVATDTDSGNVGGLVGYVDEDSNDPGEQSSSIVDSASMGNVSGGSNVGGLIGRATSNGNSSLLVERSFATGNVTAEYGYAGGLIGNTYSEGWDGSASITIRNVYAWGNVSGGEELANAGGLIGESEVYDDGGPASLVIENTYAKGSVIAYENAGGLIGRFYEMYGDTSASISNSYAAGMIDATGDVNEAGFIGSYQLGDNSISSDGNYFDETRSNQSVCSGVNTLSDCGAVNIANSTPNYFINNNTNAPLDEWNFSSIWVKNPGMHPIFTAISYDVDGVSNDIENAAPNNGDGNGDGLIDSLQTNVTSLPNEEVGTNAYVTVEADPDGDCSSITTITQGSESDYSTDTMFNYPVGLTDFTLSCTTPGGSSTVVVYYDKLYNTSNWVVRKFVSGSFVSVPGASFSTATIGSNTVTILTYTLTDGGPLDDDGTANGVIVDPVGPAVLAASNANTVGTPNTGLQRTDYIQPVVLILSGLMLAGFATVIKFRSSVDV